MVAASLIRAPTSWSWSGEVKAGMDGVVEGVQGAWVREHKAGIDSSLLSAWLRSKINSPSKNALVSFSDIINLWWFIPSQCIPPRSGRQISPPRCYRNLQPGIFTYFLFFTTELRSQLLCKNLPSFSLSRIHLPFPYALTTFSCKLLCFI